MAAECLSISERAADSSGFVLIRDLLKQFNAELIFRPLLVEAMLCEIAKENSTADGVRWLLLVDSDKYSYSDEVTSKETSRTPLPERLRNTVAHELAHSLAFDTTGPGIKLVLGSNRRKKNQTSIVKDIERHTEALSPLLLVSDLAIDVHFPASMSELTIAELIRIRRAMGISRYLLVNRLELLKTHGKSSLLFRPGLFNTAIGVGRWTSDGVPCLSGWPVYENFDRGIMPEFLRMPDESKMLPITEFITDPSFVFNGGNQFSATMRIRAGTMKNPQAEPMDVIVSIENRKASSKHTFLILVRSTNGAE